MIFADAKKAKTSMKGQVLLQWNFHKDGFAERSIQMTEEEADQILAWRDEAVKKQDKK